MHRFLKLILIFFASLFTLHASPSNAHARRGFYQGPFITLSAGLMQFDWDVNQRTQNEEANRWQTMLHLGFGWNLTDVVAPELNMRFGTDQNGGQREYIASGNLGLNITFLANPFLQFEKLKILPFIKPGFITQIALLPGDPLADDNFVTSIGVGSGIGGGFRFLFKEYFYFGLEVEQDWIWHPTKMQTVNGASTLIYQGGFKNQLEGLAMVGVHF